VHESLQFLRPFKHVLTHKDLHLNTVFAAFPARQDMPATNGEAGDQVEKGGWFSATEWSALGLPAPIRKLLENGSV
jgi:A/G-specific adenine glycosylase